MGWPRASRSSGAGTMGVGISHVFASNGIPTVLVDTAELAEAARERSLALLARLEAAGNVAAGAAEAARANVTAAASVAEGVDGADLVVEAVVERPDVKAAVYAEIEAAAGRDAVIATNTVDPDRRARRGAAPAGAVPRRALVRARRCSCRASR